MTRKLTNAEMLDEFKLRYSLLNIMIEGRKNYIKTLPKDDCLPWREAIGEYKQTMEYYKRRIERLEKVMRVDQPKTRSYDYKLKSNTYNPVY